MRGRVEGGFKQTNEEPDGDNMVRSLRRCETEGQHGPYQLASRNPDRRAQLGENNLRWDLAEDIPDCPGRVDEVELVSAHLEVFFHAAHVGIGDLSPGD